MKDLLIKRNKLRNDAMTLRSVKFDKKVNGDRVTILNKEQDDLWKKYKFYDYNDTTHKICRKFFRTRIFYISTWNKIWNLYRK